MKSKALLLLVVLTQLTCHQVIFTAPPGTDMTCSSNPGVIGAFNGVSTISCILIEGQIGTPVADGTVVQFFTNLGRIPEQGRTNDGVVRVNLTADGRSGVADIQVFSGGGDIPATTPTSGTTSTTLTPSPGRSSVSASSASGSATVSALMATGTARVTIGNTAANSIRITAFPPRLTDSRTAQLTASVFDVDGNPVAGVPVFFEVVSGTTVGPSPTPVPGATPTPAGDDPIFEHLDSQGQPRFTDSNGQAFDVLRTRYPRDAATREVVVRASVSIGSVTPATTRVFVN